MIKQAAFWEASVQFLSTSGIGLWSFFPLNKHLWLFLMELSAVLHSTLKLRGVMKLKFQLLTKQSSKAKLKDVWWVFFACFFL